MFPQVIAEETKTFPKLSSTATLTVSIIDSNDNKPIFDQDTYSATISGNYYYVRFHNTYIYIPFHHPALTPLRSTGLQKKVFWKGSTELISCNSL